MTLIALLGLFMPLKAALAEDRTLSVIRVAILLLTGILAMITFIRSFIANRKGKQLIYARKSSTHWLNNSYCFY